MSIYECAFVEETLRLDFRVYFKHISIVGIFLYLGNYGIMGLLSVIVRVAWKAPEAQVLGFVVP